MPNQNRKPWGRPMALSNVFPRSSATLKLSTRPVLAVYAKGVVIVGGTYQVEPGLREQYVAERSELMRRSRSERGCLEYVFSADPLDPGRVVLFEVWESQGDLDAHLAATRAGAAPSPTLISATTSALTKYEVSGHSPL
jgi:quinol monooxygenase YgiN